VHVELVDGWRTRELRRTVLRPNSGPDDPLPGDELAEPPVHFAALVDRATVVSTCFVYVEACPWRPADPIGWHLRQMATAEQYRGHGYAGAVLDAVVAYIAADGGGTLWCNARELAVPVYLRAGLIAEGDLFTDAVHTIPHLRMWRPVDSTK
jgi:GNAT superfamily N-acetyltransferase